MKDIMFSIILFIIDMLCFLCVGNIFSIPDNLLYRVFLIWFIIMFMYRHYKLQSTLIWEEMRSLAKGFIYFSLISLVITYPTFHWTWKVIGVAFFVSFISLFFNRIFRIVCRKILARKTLIIGVGEEALRIGRIAHNNRFALTEIMGYIDVHHQKIDDELDVDIYDYQSMNGLIEKYHVTQIIIALPDASQEEIDTITKDLFNKVDYIKILPQLNFTMTFNSKVNDFDGELLISTSRGKLGFIQRCIKRVIDIFAGLAGCLLLIPLTFYVKHKNRKNGDYDDIFFTQERIGIHGKPIYIKKYRSMIPHAEEVLEELMEKDPAIKEEYLTNKKLVNDPRITEAGHFLRKTSLDEFPQFINVLKGEMSLVGPRPYLPREKEDMDIYYESVIACKPGITGMWQANGRSDVGFIDRCKLDDYYYRNWTLGLDMIIIYKTIKSVIYGKGAL